MVDTRITVNRGRSRSRSLSNRSDDRWRPHSDEEQRQQSKGASSPKRRRSRSASHSRGRRNSKDRNKGKKHKDVEEPEPEHTVPLGEEVYASHRVHIRNLSYKTTSDDLKNVMAKCGKVVDAWVVNDNKGQSKGVAFVEFEHREDAAKAVLEETIAIDGRKAHVHYAKPKEGEDLPFRIHVSMMSSRTNDKDLRRHFREFGDVKDAWVVVDKAGKSRKFGFVDFVTGEGVAKSLKEGHKIDGEEVEVKFARSLAPPIGVGAFNGPHNLGMGMPMMMPGMHMMPGMMMPPMMPPPHMLPVKRIQVSGLSSRATRHDLKKEFGGYGEILDAWVSVDKDGKSTGIGFVEYKKEADAVEAMKMKKHYVNDRQVEVVYDRPRQPQMPSHPGMPMPMFPGMAGGMGPGRPHPGMPMGGPPYPGMFNPFFVSMGGAMGGRNFPQAVPPPPVLPNSASPNERGRRSSGGGRF